MEIFRNIFKRRRQDSEEVRRQQEQELEEYARSSIVWLYTYSESLLADTSAHMQKRIATTPIAREFERRMGFETIGSLGRFFDENHEQFEQSILENVQDANKRKQIHEEALKGARDFWDNLLEQPDNQPGVIITGRRRLTIINEKLEKLSDNPQQPNSPQ